MNSFERDVMMKVAEKLTPIIESMKLATTPSELGKKADPYDGPVIKPETREDKGVGRATSKAIENIHNSVETSQSRKNYSPEDLELARAGDRMLHGAINREKNRDKMTSSESSAVSKALKSVQSGASSKKKV